MTDPRVDDALRRCIDAGEIGVQVAAYLGDEIVVDAWVGTADRERAIPVTGDTLFSVFSVVKGVTAAALHLQVERGLVAYDTPICTYWPEFARHGKHDITVRHVLMHRSGVPQMPPGSTAELVGDWEWVVHGIEDLHPLCPPGTTSTYEAQSFGWLVGEVVRRTDPEHRSFAQFVRDELCEPLGIDDIWIGLPDAQHGRVATLVSDFVQPSAEAAPYHRLATPPGLASSPEIFNQAATRRACMPGSGGIVNARSIARFFAMFANRGVLDGVRLFSPEMVRSFAQPRPDPDEVDLVVGFAPPVGMAGFFVGGGDPPREPVVGSGDHVFFSRGAGGSIAWADPDRALAVAIVHNRMFTGHVGMQPGDHPFQPLADAVRAVCAERA